MTALAAFVAIGYACLFLAAFVAGVVVSGWWEDIQDARAAKRRAKAMCEQDL